MDVIDSFTGDYYFLSNFYEWSVVFDNIIFPTSEHAFQAAKTESRVDREAIARAPYPGAAKMLGRRVNLRPHWDEYWRYHVMWKLLQQKFMEPYLRDWLHATGDAILIEGNTWGDKTWGMVRNPYDNWEGCNLLGWMLMEIRSGGRLPGRIGDLQ